MSLTTAARRPWSRGSGLRAAPSPLPGSAAAVRWWSKGPDLPVRDRVAASAISALARWTPYVESEICGLRQLVEPGAVCIDIGAAAGIYTMALSRLAGPRGQVHSVEPLPFANLLVARMLNVGRVTNVRQHAVALGAEAGIDFMSVPVGRFGLVTGRSFLDRRAGGPDPNTEFAGQVTVTVTVDTLDGLCARLGIERLDFVKIDVEGAELEVLEGGRGIVDACRPAFLVEIEARHAARYRRSPDEVMGWLFERGYSMHTWHHGWRATWTIDPCIRNYLFRPISRDHPAPTPGRERRLSVAA